MSFIKIQLISPYEIGCPEVGFIYFGRDEVGLWEKFSNCDIRYVTTGTTSGSGDGSSGSSGRDGLDGSFFGTHGTSGTSGKTGSSGSSGITGTAGTSGKTGTSGSSGITGTAGSSGFTGTSGTSGKTGSSGKDGSFFGSSGISGYDGAYGGSSRRWIFSSIIPLGNGNFYTPDSNFFNLNTIKIKDTDADGQNLTTWMNSWRSGIFKIEQLSNLSNFGLYSIGITTTIIDPGPGHFYFEFIGLTKYDASINGFIEGENYIISYVPSGSGTSGTSGKTGTSGISGLTGTSGTSGSSGISGKLGSSGTSGIGISGSSGESGTSGTTGTSGSSGKQGTSGTSGTSGTTGTSGTSGSSGISFNVFGSNEGDFLIWSGGTWVSMSGIIGTAEDGTYTDGLFSTWTSGTTIGTSMDNINEVLLGLAPPPAPSLSSTSTSITGTVQASSGKISFGTDNMISGYWYSGFTVGTSYYLSAGNGSVTGTLANNVTAHAFSYVANSFTNTGIITISNIYSGTTYSHSVNLGLLATGSTYVSTVSGITITLTAASFCKFSDGSSFRQFTYRTGTWSISSTNLNNGFNAVQVLYQSSSIGNTSFMVDKDVTSTTVTVPVLTGLTMTGSKYISGVRYHTSGTALYSCLINNAYENTYYNAGTIPFTTTNCTMVSTTIPDVTGLGSDTIGITITNRSATINNPIRLLNQSIDARVTSVLRTLSRSSTPTGNAVQTINGILMDGITDVSTVTLDYFDGEGYRLKNNTYTVWNDITGSTNAWDSIDNLTGITGLQVYGGTLVYPSINFSTITYAYSGNPNYVGLTGAKTYVRKFYLGTSIANMVIVISGSGSGTFKDNTDSTGNYIWVEAQSGLNPGPNLTGWKDCFRTVVGGGIYASTYGASRTFGGNWGITFGVSGTSYSGGYVMLRITTNTTITLTQLSLTAY